MMRKSLLWVIFGIIILGCRDQPLIFPAGHDAAYWVERTRDEYQISSYDTTGGNNDRWSLAAGDTAIIADVSGPGLINRMWFTFDSRDPDYLRHIILRIFWDGEQNPSVWSPVGDFFGSPFRYEHFTAQFIGMSSGGYYCYFPMPFSQHARVEIINRSSYPLYALYFHINVGKLREVPSHLTTFHARWQREVRTQDTIPYTALDMQGRGYFAGLHYSGESYHSDLGYLEGDEQIYVDGEPRPSTHGTGIEDYLNSGWYFRNGVYAADFHGLVVKDDATSRISAYRHHIRDAIPFDKSLLVQLEHGQVNDEEADIATVAFWYQEGPTRQPAPEIPDGHLQAVTRKVAWPVLEGEAMILPGVYNPRIVDRSDAGPDWSNDHELWFGLLPGQETRLSMPNLKESGYDLTLYLTGSPQGGDLVIRGGAQPLAVKTYRDNLLPLPEWVVPAISNAPEVSLTLANPSQTDTLWLGLDAIRLEPVRHYIPSWAFIGPFDNPRINDDLRFGLDSVYPPEQNWDPRASYTGKNGQEVHWELLPGEPAGYGMQLWRKVKPSEFVICYAQTFIHAPRDTVMPMMFGSDDGIKVFLNDTLLHRFLAVRVAAPDQTTIDLPLHAGWNKLLLKLENNFGGYGFYARIQDRNDILSYDPKLSQANQ
ncbi:MAG: DUF2961 domain-containing protein [Saprospiraceae bacterium]|nr:DUF2961 domain-containing protein [Saprospiraceae bacterium]MCB9321859.1 DUF2961 domain-containing protein [Lewinellaceae bacterium]